MSAIRYRPDIDGLRAIAILAVVLYHAGVPGMGGGFVGVDIFFVISGFLICSLLWGPLAEGSFSFAAFADSRIRRLAPAQFILILAVLAACAVVFFPADLEFVAEQAAAQVASASNIFFYERVNYFQSSRILMPLLHLWSLSLEVQFYILCPVILLIVRKLFSRHAMQAILFLMAASFCLSVWMVLHDQKAAFYLLPFRLWEFLTGCVIALQGKRFSHQAWQNSMASFMGLVLILVAVIGFQQGMPFPGIAAIVPCLGAALILWAHQGQGDNTGFVARLLSCKPLVFIGLISYSWYLWHWPVLVIAEYITPESREPWFKTILLVIGFIAAVLSWKYVEQPFRSPRWKASRRVTWVSGIVAGAVVVTIAGGIIFHQSALKTKASEIAAMGEVTTERSEYNCATHDNAQFAQGDICQTNPAIKPSFALWGDSYATASTSLFYDLSERYHRNGYILARASCPPLIGHFQSGEPGSEECHEFNEKALSFIKRNGIKNVFIFSNLTSWFAQPYIRYKDTEWYDTYKDAYPNIAVAGLQRTIDTLNDAGVRVYIFLPTPVMMNDVPRLAAIEERYGVKRSKAFIPVEDYRELRTAYMAGLIKNNQNTNVVFIDPLKTFCPDDKCWGIMDGKPLFYDQNHLSLHGNKMIEPLFEPIFQNAL